MSKAMNELIEKALCKDTNMDSIIKDSLTVKDFTIDRAFKLLKNGNRIARRGWNGKNLFIEMCPGHFVGKLWCVEMMVIREKDSEEIKPWVPSMSDFMASDWCMVL